jgi:hypothetical protein
LQTAESALPLVTWGHGVTDYRLFLLDEKGAIQARQELIAEDDETAIALSTIICEACSECYVGYELWSFDRMVMRATESVGKVAQVALSDITRDMQERVLDLEDTIQRSHWRVAKSKKLLEATDGLRRTIAKKDEAD